MEQDVSIPFKTIIVNILNHLRRACDKQSEYRNDYIQVS